LRDRADLEAKRANAIKYIDRSFSGERIVFTTELAQNDELVGQERVVFHDGLKGAFAGIETFTDRYHSAGSRIF